MPSHELYGYSPIYERRPLQWPGGKKLAVYVGLNIEHFPAGKEATSISSSTVGLFPDPLNQGWRDYGLRIGIWRIVESLDRHGLKASALLNSAVCDQYPQVIAAGNARAWAWIAHGRDNATFQTGMTHDQEVAYLSEVIETIESHTGVRPRGWLGPALTETPATPSILAGLGLSYVLDWCADDQPFHLNVPGMISVPYSIEVNDIRMVGGGYSGPEFLQMVIDQYEQLSKDSHAHARVMSLSLHPFIIGQPFRHKYLDLALEFLAQQPDVWLTTSDEIATHYLSEFPSAVSES